MRQEGILADSKDISAYLLDAGDSERKSRMLLERFAKLERYIPINTVCRRALIHFPPMQEPRFIETPDRSAESYQMLIDYASRDGVPF